MLVVALSLLLWVRTGIPCWAQLPAASPLRPRISGTKPVYSFILRHITYVNLIKYTSDVGGIPDCVYPRILSTVGGA